MPYLHWGVQKPSLAEKQLQEHYTKDAHHSLHVRRTLDQYYYHTLPNTDERDKSQTITHFLSRHGLEPQVLTMADQLWLWVLRDTEGAETTVVSCFPDVDRLKQHNRLDWFRRPEIMNSIVRHMTDEPLSIQSAMDLATLTVARCSRIYLDKGSSLSFGKGFPSVLFSEIYETTISKLVSYFLNQGLVGITLTNRKMQEETASFSDFISAKSSELVSIAAEIRWLWEIKDVLDELNIMTVLFNDQRRIIKLFEDTNTMAHTKPDVKHSGSEDPPSYESRNQGLDPKDGAPAFRIGSATTEQLSLPLTMVRANISDIEGMTQRAQKAYKAVRKKPPGNAPKQLTNAASQLNLLVDLKLKHNDVKGSNDSLRLTRDTAKLTENIAGLTANMAGLAEKADQQGRTVMTFTIVTIIFVREHLEPLSSIELRELLTFLQLPLSLLTTVFQLDIKQFKGNDTGKYELGYISEIIFPISITISALLICIAFKSNALEQGVRAGWEKPRGGIKAAQPIPTPEKTEAAPRRRKHRQRGAVSPGGSFLDIERQ
ncbi:hypothetical protein NX059_006237 [Plenodomus lindquistii]|nr:hypothetical protein NX059_006237 [Plenodomus lindquistii]